MLKQWLTNSRALRRDKKRREKKRKEEIKKIKKNLKKFCSL